MQSVAKKRNIVQNVKKEKRKTEKVRTKDFRFLFEELCVFFKCLNVHIKQLEYVNM